MDQEESAEARLRNTYRQLIKNIYIRVMAESSGRSFADIDPHERMAIVQSFEEAIDLDVQMLDEVGQQYRLLGFQKLPEQDDPDEDLVLDTDDEDVS